MVVAPPPKHGEALRAQLARLVAAFKAATETAAREYRAAKPRPAARTATGARLVFHVQVEKDELDGGYVAECTDLPGCVSQGDTEREALAHLVEAISGVLEVRMQRHLEDVAPGEYRLAPAGPQRLELPVA